VYGISRNGQVKKKPPVVKKLRQEVIYMGRKYTKVEHLAGIVKERQRKKPIMQ